MADITLYGGYNSSCSGRLRIALNLKSLSYKDHIIDLESNKHHDEEYAKINPSRSIPTLLVSDQTEHVITQSMASLEFLEEYFPETTRLLPPVPDFDGRAKVRAMAAIIVSDVQPVANSKTLAKAESLGCEKYEWAREFNAQGFRAYEGIASQTPGKYSYGDNITMADVCLVPAMWNAEIFQLDLAPYPTLVRICKELNQLPEIQKAHWKAQNDCPEHLRS